MMVKNQLIRKILSFTIYVVMAAVVAFLIIDRHPPTLAVGTVAPMDEKLNLENGSSITFKKLLTKPMVVNFWASWCPPCIKELPIFSKISKKFRGQVIFVGAALGTGWDDIHAAAKQFVIEYPLLQASDQVAEVWQGRALPTTYVIDTQGKILWAKTGISSESDLEQAIGLALANNK